MRWCWQMLVPPHSLHRLLMRWCWQMLAPPHSLHLLLSRWCWQMLAPPHSLQVLLTRWCWQMLAPPHSLHLFLWRWCWQITLLRVAPSAVAPAAAPDPLGQTRLAALPDVSVPPGARLAPASEASGVLACMVECAAVPHTARHPLVLIEV